MQGLKIHAVSVAEGILAITRLPGGEGDYASDIAGLSEWRPGLVISMTTQAEMAEAGAGDLGLDVQSSGSRWVHLPIADFGTPPADVEAQWAAVSKSALAALRGGGKVLVHCRGGCGRSGMIALRLMIEAGEAADLALERLRGVRACAVETDEQMAWAKSGRKAKKAAKGDRPE
jgi:protein tyrosine phosphatase (PTP) superfamily phosphohydrolase (DUF442 family)